MSVADKIYLTTGDAAVLTGWTINKVRALCESGRLPAINTSTASRPRRTIRRCDLEAFLTPVSVAKSQASQQASARRQRIDRDVRKVFKNAKRNRIREADPRFMVGETQFVLRF